MVRKCWFLLLCILYLQYDMTSSQSPSSAPSYKPFTFAPTPPSAAPTHGPTRKPTKRPTDGPTVAVGSDEDIKIVINVTLSGEAVDGLCSSENMDKYESSLEDVFVAASGVDESAVKKAVISDCESLVNGDVALTYNMRSGDARSRNTVIWRMDNGLFLSTYQTNLNLVFTDVLVMSAYIVTAEAAAKEKSDDDPFDDFFSAYFGLGVIIFVVSVVWCFFLRADEGDVDQVRLKQLQEEKRKFEEKYGVLEEDSVEAVDRDIPKGVELVNNTKSSTTSQETKIATNEKQAPVQTQHQTQTQTETQIKTQTQVETQQENNQPETRTDGAYRASVVNEVKHVARQEKESLDLDQIKDPGNKRRKTQEYLNNLWDDKADAKAQAEKDKEEGSDEESEEEEEEEE